MVSELPKLSDAAIYGFWEFLLLEYVSILFLSVFSFLYWYCILGWGSFGVHFVGGTTIPRNFCHNIHTFLCLIPFLCFFIQLIIFCTRLFVCITLWTELLVFLLFRSSFFWFCRFYGCAICCSFILVGSCDLNVIYVSHPLKTGIISVMSLLYLFFFFSTRYLS